MEGVNVLPQLRDRLNLFSGDFRVTPRPVVPDHWNVPEDHPSATRFWVDSASGETSWRREGEGWEPNEALKLWHYRQAGRIWLCKRLICKLGDEEARQRVKDIQTELRQAVLSPNSYLDLLVSITYEAVRRTRKAASEERLLVAAARQSRQTSQSLSEVAHKLSPAGPEAVCQAQAAARALEELVDTLGNTVSPMDARFDHGFSGDERGRAAAKRVWEWIRHLTPGRNYREPDIRWLVGAAVAKLLDNKDELTAALACRRVGRWLEKLEAPFGALNPATCDPLEPAGASW